MPKKSFLKAALAFMSPYGSLHKSVAAKTVQAF